MFPIINSIHNSESGSFYILSVSVTHMLLFWFTFHSLYPLTISPVLWLSVPYIPVIRGKAINILTFEHLGGGGGGGDRGMHNNYIDMRMTDHNNIQ